MWWPGSNQLPLDITYRARFCSKLAAHIGKYRGMFARLCLIWHCIEHAFDDKLPDTISEDVAKRVAIFVHGFMLKHAAAFYVGMLGLSSHHDRLANIASYILAHKLERVTTRDIQRGDRSMRKLERRDTDAIFEQLEALGWVTKTPGPRHSAPPFWVVNPAVHQRFTARAEAERNRRDAEHKIITGFLKDVKSEKS